MAVLTEKQIKYGFDYYHKDDARPKSVVEVSEYDGEDKLIINCTQLDESYSAKDKKRIWMEWCDFLVNNPDTLQSSCFVQECHRSYLMRCVPSVDLKGYI